jgi:hypothetical protein
VSDSDLAWARYDAIAAETTSSPWERKDGVVSYAPAFERLRALLSVPLELGLSTQSGLPAKAVDVWVASELRRAGFGEDEVWPRARRPRVLPREIALLLDAVPAALRVELSRRIEEGGVGASVSADASILGRAYNKQVDVVISQWARGPEVLISTKRMDSSLANNAFNRIEESYGDAHNLRGRHPLAAIGYVLVLRGQALAKAPSAAERLIDLVQKLGADDGGYDATCVIVADWDDTPPGSGDVAVQLNDRVVPPELHAGRFMETMIRAVLDRTPVDAHVRPRELLRGRGLSVSEDESR